MQYNRVDGDFSATGMQSQNFTNVKILPEIVNGLNEYNFPLK